MDCRIYPPDPPKRKKLKLTPKQVVAGNILLVGLVLLVTSLFLLSPPAPPPSSGGAGVVPLPVPSSQQPVYDEEFLKDKLYITQERENYQTGQLVVKIPALGLDAAVQDGTTDADMAKGPCLYDYAQLPGQGTPNVSLVAHRDVGGAQFYFAHKLGKGDLLYLVYNGSIYVYAYEDTHIVTPEDWGPIYNQGFSCLTLTTCNPIGSVRERLVVRAKLTQTLPYTKDYPYPPWEEGLTKPYAWESGAKSWNDNGAAPAASASAPATSGASHPLHTPGGSDASSQP